MILKERLESIADFLKNGEFEAIDSIIGNLDLTVKEIVEGAIILEKYAGEKAGEAFLAFIEKYAVHNYENLTDGIKALSPLLLQAADDERFPDDLKPYSVSVD